MLSGKQPHPVSQQLVNNVRERVFIIPLPCLSPKIEPNQYKSSTIEISRQLKS